MSNEYWGIILAAGSGSRLASATHGTAKQFLPYRGAPLWWRSALAMAASPRMRGLVFVFPAPQLQEAEAELLRLARRTSLGVEVRAVSGGARRQDSVRLGLLAVPAGCSRILVHDGARPFLRTSLVSRLIDSMDSIEGSIVPGIAVTDTIKEVDERGLVTHTPQRDRLRAVQTPQAFPLQALLEAHARAEAEGWDVTDDAALMERCGQNVTIIEGDMDNIKITNPADLTLLEEHRPSLPCCGYGYDVHAYGGNRPLMLGGVTIGGDWQVRAHSDGDVLLHALMDAILGCIGKGDIGQLFPDNDPKFENISSVVLLDHVLSIAGEAGLRIVHVDLTVIAQKPKLSPHAEAIRRNVARLLNLAPEHVAFKATTEEKLGFTGELLGLKAVALVTALR